MSEKKFIKGIFIKDAHKNAPDFVLAQVSINREEAIKSLSEMDEEYLNLDVLKSKEGEVYGKLNTYKKDEETESDNEEVEEVEDEEEITPEDINF